MKVKRLIYSKQLLCMRKVKTENKGRYKLPPNGGSGVWEPLSHSLFINFFYNALVFFASSWMKKVRKGKREDGGVFVFFALCLFLCSLISFGLFFSSLKTRALNTNLLNVSRKIKPFDKIVNNWQLRMLKKELI